MQEKLRNTLQERKKENKHSKPDLTSLFSQKQKRQHAEI